MARHPKAGRWLEKVRYRLDFSMLGLLEISEKEFGYLANSPTGGRYADYRDILRVADERKVLPEILVDEEFYYGRSGMAPYRLCFHIARKWPGVKEFYNYIADTWAFKPGESTLYDLLVGSLYFLRDIRLWMVLKICNLAEMPMAYLFTPYRRMAKETIYGELTGVLGALRDCDVAVLAGFARLLAQNNVDLEDVKRLLAWRDEHASRDFSVRRDACATGGRS